MATKWPSRNELVVAGDLEEWAKRFGVVITVEYNHFAQVFVCEDGFDEWEADSPEEAVAGWFVKWLHEHGVKAWKTSSRT